jgi:hypothetical protein
LWWYVSEDYYEMIHVVQKCVLDDVGVCSSDVVLPKFCVLCGCILSVDNRSEVLNLCLDCKHSLEF